MVPLISAPTAGHTGPSVPRKRVRGARGCWRGGPAGGRASRGTQARTWQLVGELGDRGPVSAARQSAVGDDEGSQAHAVDDSSLPALADLILRAASAAKIKDTEGIRTALSRDAVAVSKLQVGQAPLVSLNARLM
jgi:hypothetical protein